MASVLDPVRHHADATPDAVALRGAQRQWTYPQLHATAAEYGGALLEAGLSPGDRVLLVAPSSPEFVVAYLGIQAAGCVVVPVNTMSTPAELDHFLADAGCSLAVVWHELAAATEESAARCSVPCWRLRPGATAGPDGREPATVAQPHTGDVEDTAAILYTSGTTGRPKGAQLTVGNLLAGGEIGAILSRATAEDRSGTALPLFHVFGQAVVMMAAFTAGGSLSLLPRFEPTAMLELIRRDQLTVVAGVPTMWNAVLHAAADGPTAGISGLRVAISGGAALPEETTRAFEVRFGCVLLEGYGLTETSGFGTFNDLAHPPRAGYTGRAAPRLQVQVRDGDGEECPPGTVGEVYVRGATVMKGYWQRPADTAAVLSPDGWFRTGDLGELAGTGELRIVDRVKDLIIRGGYNVYPREVEEVLYEHPDIVEAAVVGVPDAHYGEEIAAAVVARNGAPLTADAVQAWLRERLSAYKLPRVVRFWDELPKGPSGKILKRSLDREALAPQRPPGSRTAARS